MIEEPLTSAATDPAKAHPHRRSSDTEEVVKLHKRWYDSVRMYWAIGVGLVSIITTCIAIGFHLDQWVFKIEDAPVAIAIERDRINGLIAADSLAKLQDAAEHNRMWEAINANRMLTADLMEKQDQTLEIVLELFCFVQEQDDIVAQQGCVKEQTQSRIRSMLRPSNGGTP